MVLDYFNLREHPFGVTPDSKFLFLGDSHGEALASIAYGIEAGRGFVALIAKPGLGKTTLLFHAMNQMRDEVKTVFLFERIDTPIDLLRALLAGLGVRECKGSLTELQLTLQDVLIQEFRLGKRVVAVIDEAQNLDHSVLEFVRMLSNFETTREKLIQIVLSGQPQLAEKIGSPELVQLRQRVSIVAQLVPFSAAETTLYIEHRLRIAGYNSETPLFTAGALALIAEHSEGVARNINNLCFNSLALGCALRQQPIDVEIVHEVAGDLSFDRFRKPAPDEPLREKASARTRRMLPVAGASPGLRGLMGKVAVTAAALLILGATLLVSHPWRTARVAGQAKSATPAVAAARPVRSVSVETQTPPLKEVVSEEAPAKQEPAAELGADTIQITPGKTLGRICADHFGKCGPEILKEIHRLNPRLNDLDHIEIGQILRIPATASVSRASATEPVSKGNGAARE